MTIIFVRFAHYHKAASPTSIICVSAYGTITRPAAYGHNLRHSHFFPGIDLVLITVICVLQLLSNQKLTSQQEVLMCQNTIEIFRPAFTGLVRDEVSCGTSIYSESYPFRKIDTLRCDDCIRSNSWMDLQNISFEEVSP
jgi:hypothetical protein